MVQKNTPGNRYGANTVLIHGGPELAAYLMGAIASIDFTQTQGHRQTEQLPQYEKPLKNTRNNLPFDLHVFPVKSIERFVGHDRRVSVYDIRRRRVCRKTLKNVIFCAKRAWDTPAEVGYMKRIEDAFQVLAMDIIGGTVSEIGSTKKGIVDYFYALWYLRARFKNLATQEIRAKGVLGTKLTKTQEEALESNGFRFAREGGRIPARQLNGLTIQIRSSIIVEWSICAAQWGIIQAQEGEFLVPDVPIHTVIPLARTLCLISPAANGTITKQDVAEINHNTAAASQEYYFAYELSKCPM